MKIEAILICLVAIQIEVCEGRLSIDREMLGAMKKANRRQGSMLRSKYKGRAPISINNQGLFMDGDAVVAPMSEKRLFELDMVLTEKQEDILIHKKHGRSKRAAIKTDLWPGKTVPYAIATNQFSPTDLDLIDQAMKNWTDRTCVQFRPKTSSDSTYLNILGNPDGCWSYVGYQNNVQDLNLENPGCVYLHTIGHELGHAIGLYHEQSRPDRDDYVTVLWNNIYPGYSHNFNKYDTNTIDSKGWAYDYRSVMHYGRNYFALSGDTLQTTDPSYQTIIGTAPYISFRDAAVINDMYSCNRPHCSNSMYQSHCENNTVCFMKKIRPFIMPESCLKGHCPPVTCQPSASEYYVGKDCQCYCPVDDGTDIVLCSVDTNDDCTPNPCLNNGVCTDIGTTYTCDCAAGYIGTNCETAGTDYCASGPCNNGGICTNTATSFSCDCPAGYSGTTCQDVTNHCVNAPCLNGGTCTSTSTSFTCQCAPGYSGSTCEVSCSDLMSVNNCLILVIFAGCNNPTVSTFCPASCNAC